jgi:hypothetical protein
MHERPGPLRGVGLFSWYDFRLEGFLGKDDWKYDEDAWNEMEDEGKKTAPPPEKQCAQCLHWVDREALYCPWCGKALGEVDRKR